MRHGTDWRAKVPPSVLPLPVHQDIKTAVPVLAVGLVAQTLYIAWVACCGGPQQAIAWGDRWCLD